MKSLLYLLLPAIFFTGICLAQDSMQPAFALKLHPLGITDYQQTIWLAAEKRLAGPFAIQLDAGYIFRDASFSGRLYDPFHVRAELRCYNGRTHTGKKSSMNPYLAGQLFYKQERFYMDREACPHPWETGNSMFFGDYPVCNGGTVTDDYKYDRYVYGVHVKYGWQRIWNSGLILDMYAGFGLRKIEEYYSATDGYPDPEDGVSLYPSVTGSIKIGWKFK